MRHIYDLHWKIFSMLEVALVGEGEEEEEETAVERANSQHAEAEDVVAFFEHMVDADDDAAVARANSRRALNEEEGARRLAGNAVVVDMEQGDEDQTVIARVLV